MHVEFNIFYFHLYLYSDLKFFIFILFNFIFSLNLILFFKFFVVGEIIFKKLFTYWNFSRSSCSVWFLFYFLLHGLHRSFIGSFLNFFGVFMFLKWLKCAGFRQIINLNKHFLLEFGKHQNQDDVPIRKVLLSISR